MTAPITSMPQIAKNTRPEVIAAVEHFWAAVREAQVAAFELVEKYGSREGFYGGPSMGKFVVQALGGDKPTTGRWKRQGRGWAPYKNDPINAEFEALTVPLPEVPGIPPVVMGEGCFMEPRPFVHDGAAYYRLPQMPTPERYGTSAADEGWVEIKASEYYAAREALDEERAS